MPLAVITAYFDEARAQGQPTDESCAGRGLRRLGAAHRLTPSEVADRISVPPRMVYNWESGDARLPNRLLVLLAEVFSTSTDNLQRWLRRGPVRVIPQAPGPQPAAPAPAGGRLAAGRSQDQLARSVGVGLSSLKAWEYGAAPALPAIRGLALALDLPAVKLASTLGLALPRELVSTTWQPGDLSEVLRALRLWNQLTQAELAARCGCSLASVRS